MTVVQVPCTSKGYCCQAIAAVNDSFRSPAVSHSFVAVMGNAQAKFEYESPKSLAQKLARKSPIILAFLSPSCSLCASLAPNLVKASSSSPIFSSPSNFLLTTGILLYSLLIDVCCFMYLFQAEDRGRTVARVNALQPDVWAPEMLAYDIDTVPCFVLLDSNGMWVHVRQQCALDQFAYF